MPRFTFIAFDLIGDSIIHFDSRERERERDREREREKERKRERERERERETHPSAHMQIHTYYTKVIVELGSGTGKNSRRIRRTDASESRKK